MASEKLPAKVLMTGGTGLIGSALKKRLRDSGIEIVELARRARQDAFPWNAEKGMPPPPEAFKGVDAVIHLAGVPIDRRWSEAARRRIHDSRVIGTRVLAEAIANIPPPRRPATFICMSGVAAYGTHRPGETLDERATLAPANKGFLSDLTRDWEAVSHIAARANVRTVQLRTGMVLAREGGALKKMLPAFRLGLGGPMGPGTQKISWISLTDLVSLIFFALRTDALQGPVNATSPQSVTNADFARALGKAVNRPATFHLPSAALTLLFGDMAKETILADLDARPVKAMEAGFAFRHARLDDALQETLYPCAPRTR